VQQLGGLLLLVVIEDGDLLIANEPEGESEKVSEGPSGPQTRKDDEDEIG
jgi:hypothetical protein